MGIRSRCIAPAAVALGLYFAAGVGQSGLISPAMAQPGTLTKKQSDALNTYNEAVKNFEAILRQRRAQIDSKQPLPNLPGQALYLARNTMMSAYKDLTDARSVQDRKAQQIRNPAGVFRRRQRAAARRVRQTVRAHAGAARQRAEIGYAVQGRRRSRNGHCARQRASMRRMPTRQAASASGCSLPRPTAIRTSAMRARTNTREVFRPAHPKIKMAEGSGRRSRTRSPPSIPR